MLALVIARPGPVRDGLVALLEAAPDIRKIVQITQAEDAWEFVQTISPDITLIHGSPFAQEISDFISSMKRLSKYPILVIAISEEDKRAAAVQGADVVVLEGLPSSKLATQITSLLHQGSNIQ